VAGSGYVGAMQPNWRSPGRLILVSPWHPPHLYSLVWCIGNAPRAVTTVTSTCFASSTGAMSPAAPQATQTPLFRRVTCGREALLALKCPHGCKVRLSEDKNTNGLM
jgi:hypothetical protein